MNVAFVRGAFLNMFEAQNFRFDASINVTAFSSLYPIHRSVPFNRIALPSISDLKIPRYIANRTFGDSQLLWGLENYMKDFDIAHSADPHYYYSYQLARMREQGTLKKLLLTSWETIPFNNESVWAKKRIKYYSMKYADAFLCYSERAAECLIQEGVRAERIHTIPLGVDLKRFKHHKKHGVRPTRILFVGRLVPEKGILDLIEAFKRIPDKTTELVIIGDGPLKNQISLPHVVIRTASYMEIHKEYAEADIAVFPSKKTKTWEEQYGMAIVESMASGLPIVAYNSGSIQSIVGNCGLIVPEGNISKLSAALARLVKDKTLRQKLGTMCRKRAQDRYDARNTARKIARLYKAL